MLKKRQFSGHVSPTGVGPIIGEIRCNLKPQHMVRYAEIVVDHRQEPVDRSMAQIDECIVNIEKNAPDDSRKNESVGGVSCFSRSGDNRF